MQDIKVKDLLWMRLSEETKDILNDLGNQMLNEITKDRFNIDIPEYKQRILACKYLELMRFVVVYGTHNPHIEVSLIWNNIYQKYMQNF